jgi:DNA-binding transcriptional MerR regulator
MTDNSIQNYTIRETAKLTGLPESTLRYYETIGLIHPITRDSSSKHRVYSEDDVNSIIALACLSAIGMSIENIRAYLKNQSLGEKAADEQVELLETQQKPLAEEAQMLEQRRRYVDSKIAFWKAVKSGSKEEIEAARKRTFAIAQELKLPKVLSNEEVNSSVVS